MGGRRVACAGWAVVLLVGCSAGSPERTGPAPSVAADGGRVTGVLDGVELSLEVADDVAERAVGLMRRESVPPGTGMVFLHDGLSTGRYYMYDVPVPLRAVFVREGRVVSTVVMPPCEEDAAADCPTYGAEGPYDTVVETAPETLPDVEPGDVFELRG
jgi:uncharacterized membrane protein (UPF0127 family)